jgi:hypothetical protein
MEVSSVPAPVMRGVCAADEPGNATAKAGAVARSVAPRIMKVLRSIIMQLLPRTLVGPRESQTTVRA